MAWGRTVATFALGVMSMAAACGTLSSAPLGNGDRVIGDVDATKLPPQPTENVPPDSPFAPVDGSRSYGPEYDAYALSDHLQLQSCAGRVRRRRGAAGPVTRVRRGGVA